MLHEVQRSLTLSRMTLPGRGQAPQWQKTDNWTPIRDHYTGEPDHNSFISNPSWDSCVIDNFLRPFPWLFAVFSLLPLQRGVAWHPSVSLTMSTEPRDGHREKWRTLKKLTNAHSVLRITQLSTVTVFGKKTQHKTLKASIYLVSIMGNLPYAFVVSLKDSLDSEILTLFEQKLYIEIIYPRIVPN